MIPAVVFDISSGVENFADDELFLMTTNATVSKYNGTFAGFLTFSVNETGHSLDNFAVFASVFGTIMDVSHFPLAIAPVIYIDAWFNGTHLSELVGGFEGRLCFLSPSMTLSSPVPSHQHMVFLPL